DRAEPEPCLQGCQQARARRPADRTRMAEGDGRRDGTRTAVEQDTARRARADHGPGLGSAAALLRVCRTCLGRDLGAARSLRTRLGAEDGGRPGLAEPVSPDQWQAHVTTDAALAMGRLLEARGRLDRPIASLPRRDLECMASNAIS